jgi:hypothetical protein
MFSRIAAAMLMVAAAATVASAAVTGPPQEVPEPSLLTLLATGAGSALLYVRNRRSKP